MTPATFCRRAGRRLLRPIKKLDMRRRVFADYASWLDHDRLLKQGLHSNGGEARKIRVKDLNGNTVLCRPGTTDVNVFDDTFFGRYHIPPVELGTISTILDLGSNIGLTIAHYATMFPNAKILGIEMDHGNWAICQKNIEPFKKQAEVEFGAVWISNGTIRYGGPMESAFCVDESLNEGTEVKTITVADLIKKMGCDVVDFVKMDVEGAEEQLLDQCDDWIQKVRCIKIELHEPYTVEQCTEALARHNFDVVQDTSHWACVLAWNTRLQ